MPSRRGKSATAHRPERADARRRAGNVDVVVVDDRRFADAVALMRTGVPTIVLGADDDPGFALRAQRHGASRWVLKESVSTVLPALLRHVSVSS